MKGNLVDNEGNDYPLEEGHAWSFGSEDQNPQYTLDLGEESASFQLTLKEGSFQASPSSSLPLILNGQELSEETPLKEGDSLSFGPKTFVFQEESEEEELGEEEDLLAAYDEMDDPEPEDILAQVEQEDEGEDLGQETEDASPSSEEPNEPEEENSPEIENDIAGEEDAELEEEAPPPPENTSTPEAENEEPSPQNSDEPEHNPIEEGSIPNEENASSEEETITSPEDSPSPKEEEAPPKEEDSIEEEEIFTPLEGSEAQQVEFSYHEEERWLLKVLGGPNKGAEFPLKEGESYFIGHDSEECDVVLYDLSISKRHAKLTLTEDNKALVEDLGSKNGTYLGDEKIEGESEIATHQVLSLGTTSLLLLDKESHSQTIVAELPKHLRKEEEEAEEEEKEEEKASEEEEEVTEEDTALLSKKRISLPALVLTLAIFGFLAIMGIGTKSLFSGKQITIQPPDQVGMIKQSLRQFPSVEFSFNKTTGKLFLLGHLSSLSEENQLLYEVQNLLFIKEIINNIIIDENIWMEQNALLASNPNFESVSMHSPRPGLFVINGYVNTTKDHDSLVNYLNLHFPYLDLLENRVIVEESLNKEIVSFLLQDSLGGVTFQLDLGEVTLFGFTPHKEKRKLEKVAQKILALRGVRFLKNLVVYVSQDNSAVNISSQYKVTGYSKHGHTNVNVVIDGKIYARGDLLDGMIITGIRPRVIFLEKEGVKYKIDYHFSLEGKQSASR